MMKPVPSISQAYSMLLQHETQYEVQSISHIVPESASLSASFGGQKFPPKLNLSG